jgi:hypothetical protein
MENEMFKILPAVFLTLFTALAAIAEQSLREKMAGGAVLQCASPPAGLIENQR